MRLPKDIGGLIRFDEAVRGPLRTVAECFAEHPGAVPDGVGAMVIIGGVWVEGYEEEKVLLDRDTGLVHTATFYENPTEIGELELLAPDLDALVALGGALEEFRLGEGEFAPLKGRYGPEAVSRLTALLVERVAECDPELLEVADGVSAFWSVAARVRPLSHAAGPGKDGLRLALPDGMLERAFGTDAVVRFEEKDLPDALTHAPTRRFLLEHGLPEDDGMFRLDRAEPLRPLAEYYAYDEDPRHGEGSRLPEGAEGLVRLGYLVEDADLVVEGATGRVLGWFAVEEELEPVNTDVSTLAFTQWLIHTVQTLDDHYALSATTYPILAATATEVLRTADPTACEVTTTPASTPSWRYWPETFADESAGVLEAP